MKKPWGNFKLLKKGKLPGGQEYWIKILIINPKQAMSLQSHKHREEVWKCLKGKARITIGSINWIMTEGDVQQIPKDIRHRAECISKVPLQILEVAWGKKLSETDLKRWEDLYGRT